MAAVTPPQMAATKAFGDADAHLRYEVIDLYAHTLERQGKASVARKTLESALSEAQTYVSPPPPPPAGALSWAPHAPHAPQVKAHNAHKRVAGSGSGGGGVASWRPVAAQAPAGDVGVPLDAALDGASPSGRSARGAGRMATVLGPGACAGQRGRPASGERDAVGGQAAVDCRLRGGAERARSARAVPSGARALQRCGAALHSGGRDADGPADAVACVRAVCSAGDRGAAGRWRRAGGAGRARGPHGPAQGRWRGDAGSGARRLHPGRRRASKCGRVLARGPVPSAQRRRPGTPVLHPRAWHRCSCVVRPDAGAGAGAAVAHSPRACACLSYPRGVPADGENHAELLEITQPWMQPAAFASTQLLLQLRDLLLGNLCLAALAIGDSRAALEALKQVAAPVQLPSGAVLADANAARNPELQTLAALLEQQTGQLDKAVLRWQALLRVRCGHGHRRRVLGRRTERCAYGCAGVRP